jgi:hypothetical protein
MIIRNGRLEWGRHELAWSLRTTKFENIIYDEDGNVVDVLPSTKMAGYVPLHPESRYLLRKYYTNALRPRHKLYRLDIASETIELIFEMNDNTAPMDIDRLNVPEKIRMEMIKDLRIPPPSMEVVTVHIPRPMLDIIDRLVEKKYYANRAEAIRAAIRDTFLKEAEFLEEE